ncbi:MAG: AMP-binding protein [Deltaproteobacteria bacterium]|nr:AMP-binding protein [Deltaproteobacteria bacterium]
MFARVLKQTGLTAIIRPRGVVSTARCLSRGGSGPSAIFRIHGKNAPDRVAFRFDERAWSYGDVDRRIDRLSAGLEALGLRQRDSVLGILKNSPDVFVLGAAMSRLGGSAVSASWRSTAAELEYLLTHSGASAVFFEAELATVVRDACVGAKIPLSRAFSVNGEVEGFMTLDSVLREPRKRTNDAREGAVVIYNSGTTGKPKGAVRRFATGQIEGFFSFIHDTPMRVDDRHLVVCPMYHSTGLGFAGMALMLGGTVVIEREFDPLRFLQIVEREQITTTALVPTLLHRLMSLDDETFAKANTRSLRALFCGGAQLTGPLAIQTMKRLGPVLYNFYGATETGLVTLATPAELAQAPGTIGHSLQGTSIRLLDERGKEVSRGEVGELYAKNSMLVAGYHSDDSATRSSMRDGYFSVGDLAMQDAHGLFHIVGRKRDMVISGGVNIYPVEVEELIAAHASVSQVAVVGVPDAEWGERLRAFVVLRDGVDVSAHELAQFARERLSRAKVPREWVFVGQLPSNPTGKILKRELQGYDGPVERG